MIVEHRVSGFDFVRAMLLAGYRLTGATAAHTRIARGERALLVPQLDALTDDVLMSLLEQAGVTPLHFIALLNRLGSRDTWPEQGEVLTTVREHG